MRKRSRRLLPKVLALVMIFLLMAGAGPVGAVALECSGPSVTPTTVGGNPSEPDPPGFRVDPVVSGLHSKTVTIDSVTYVVYHQVSSDKKTLSFWVDGGAAIVKSVTVKGGPSANIYEYSGGTDEDCGLQSPRMGNGNVPQISHYDFRFEPIKVVTGEICVTKYEDSLDGDPVEGVTFYVYSGKDTEPVDSGSTDADGKVCFDDLLPGSYTVTEVLPSGWSAVDPSDGSDVVELAAGETKNLSFVNQRIDEEDGSICIEKRKDTVNGDLLSGWEFELFVDTPMARVAVSDQVYNWVSLGKETTEDGDGYIKACWKGLKPGLYKVVETQQQGWDPVTPADGVWIGMLTEGQDLSLVFVNEQKDIPDPEYGALEVIKCWTDWEDRIYNSYPYPVSISQDIYDEEPECNKPPTGMSFKFALYDSENKLVAEKTTDGQAPLLFDELEPGDYTLFEVIPEGARYELCQRYLEARVSSLILDDSWPPEDHYYVGSGLIEDNVTETVYAYNCEIPPDLIVNKVLQNSSGTPLSSTGLSFQIRLTEVEGMPEEEGDVPAVVEDGNVYTFPISLGENELYGIEDGFYKVDEIVPAGATYNLISIDPGYVRVGCEPMMDYRVADDSNGYFWDCWPDDVEIVNRLRRTSTSGGGGSTPTPTPEPEPEPEIIIPEPEVPLVVPEPEEEVIIEDEVPLALPKTGGTADGLLVLPALLTAAGYLVTRKRR